MASGSSFIVLLSILLGLALLMSAINNQPTTTYIKQTLNLGGKA